MCMASSMHVEPGHHVRAMHTACLYPPNYVQAAQHAAVAAELGGEALVEQCRSLQVDLTNCQQVGIRRCSNVLSRQGRCSNGLTRPGLAAQLGGRQA